MRKAQWTTRVGVVLAVAGLAACSDTGPGDVAQVDVTMRQTDRILAQVTGGWMASLTGRSGAAAAINPGVVASLTIDIIDIEFLNGDGEWVSPDDWTTVEDFDLMALPTEGEDPLLIGSVTVSEGDYADVRLFVGNARIWFLEDVSVGPYTFTKNTDENGDPIAEQGYVVTIPSGDQTGIKTDVAFSNAGPDDAAVDLLFSPGSTFLNVTGTGTGAVMLAPVIRGSNAE